MEPGRLIIDENGINLPSIEDIYNSLLEEWNSMFPGKETLREDNRLSPQGQLLMSIAKQIDYKNKEVLFFINQFNLNTATGYFLDLFYNNFGIYRGKSTKSHVTCTCTLKPGTTISVGDKVKNSNGDIFVSTENYTAPEPEEEKNIDINFESATVGAIPVNADSINIIAEPVDGWQEVNNAEAGTVGTADTKSRVTCQCLLKVNTVLPAGVKAKNANDQVFVSIEEGSYLAGEITKDIVFVSESEGPIPCDKGSITEIVSQKEGWLDVVNNSNGTLGSVGETDSEFRARAMNSHLINALGTDKAIYAKLMELNNVYDIKIKTNRTNKTITVSNVDISANSTFISIHYDNTDETKNKIAEILHKSCAASNYEGDTEVEIPIYNFANQNDVVRFQTAIAKQIYLTITIVQLPLYSKTTDQTIKEIVINNFNGKLENITLSKCGIGEIIYANRFFENLSTLQELDQAMIKSISISEEPEGSGDSCNISLKEYPVLNEENITIKTK